MLQGEKKENDHVLQLVMNTFTTLFFQTRRAKWHLLSFIADKVYNLTLEGPCIIFCDTVQRDVVALIVY